MFFDTTRLRSYAATAILPGGFMKIELSTCASGRELRPFAPVGRVAHAAGISTSVTFACGRAM
jgi:hypothetical protein